MVSNTLGILVGAALDRRDGDSGVKGAIEGYLVQGALKVVTPIVVTYAIGWGVQYAVRKALHAATGDPKLEEGGVPGR